MKTFKLKMLHILDKEVKEIPLIDGLIINREDETYENQWLIEAYIDKKFASYFESFNTDEVLSLLVKISKEDNEPVEFISKLIGVNQIGENINVLFKGDIKKRSNEK